MDSPKPRSTIPERLYGLLLALYPPRFRREYGPDLRQTFREMLRDEEIGAWDVCLRVLADVPGSLLVEHWASFRRGEEPLHDSAYGVFLGVMLCVAIVTTNVVAPSFTYLGLDENVAMLLATGCLLVFFAGAGFLVSRRTGRITTGARIGARTALVGMGIAMLTFLVIDNLFLDLVGTQPDKVWGFAHSDFTSMRAYVNVGLLRGFVIVLPLFVLVGAICGAVGAAMRTITRKGSPNR